MITVQLIISIFSCEVWKYKMDSRIGLTIETKYNKEINMSRLISLLKMYKYEKKPIVIKIDAEIISDRILWCIANFKLFK